MGVLSNKNGVFTLERAAYFWLLLVAARWVKTNETVDLLSLEGTTVHTWDDRVARLDADLGLELNVFGGVRLVSLQNDLRGVFLIDI